jgi:hypothetical protein
MVLKESFHDLTESLRQTFALKLDFHARWKSRRTAEHRLSLAWGSRMCGEILVKSWYEAENCVN